MRICIGNNISEFEVEVNALFVLGTPKDAPIVTPLMDFVRQKRAAKGGPRVGISSLIILQLTDVSFFKYLHMLYRCCFLLTYTLYLDKASILIIDSFLFWGWELGRAVVSRL